MEEEIKKLKAVVAAQKKCLANNDQELELLRTNNSKLMNLLKGVPRASIRLSNNEIFKLVKSKWDIN